MPKPIDLTGRRFDRLVVTEFYGNGRRGKQSVRLWSCRCDCGNQTIASYSALTNRNTRSCGCLLREAITKHGMCKTPVYKVWHAMLDRCRNSNNQSWKDYGGRGVSVCERWHDFSNFIADMGERPTGGTLDRIDVNGNYEPSNCRWISQAGNANNRRNNRLIEFQGEVATLSEWSKKYGMHKGTLKNRLDSGWPFEAAVSMPPDRRASNIATRKRSRATA